MLWVPGIILLAKRKIYDMAFQNTCWMSEMLGYLIAIVGPIRCGKTTLGAGLLHIFQINQQRKLRQQMDNAILVLDHLDFNRIDEVIMAIATKVKRMNMDKLTDAVLKLYKDKLKALYFNEFEFVKYEEILKDYVEAYYCLNIRNQYVFSKTRVYSHITGKCSLTFDDKWTQIYKVADTHEFPLDKYYFFYWDEVTLDRGAVNNTDQIKDPDGTKEFKALFGHIFEETGRLLSTKQSFIDEVARERRLTSSTIEITGRSEIGTFNKLRRLFKRFENIKLFFLLLPFNLQMFFRTRKEKEENPKSLLLYQKFKQTGKYRDIRYKYACIDNFLKSLGYIKTLARIYHNSNDVGKESEKYYTEVEFVIPMHYCYGVIDTHYFSPVLDELKKLSYISDIDVPKSTIYTTPEERKNIVRFIYENKKVPVKKMSFKRN